MSRSTWIALTAITRPLLQAVAPAKVMVILKANAYGHGMVPVARHLARHRRALSGRGRFSRKASCCARRASKTPILVLGGIIGNQVPLFLEHDLTLTASSVEKLQQINEAAEGARR